MILQEITLRPGMPLGADAVEESANRLRQMGVFSRVRIQEEPRLAGETIANLVVLVEESPATTLGGGGGLEVRSVTRRRADDTFEDVLDFSPRAFFEIGRRNLGGRNRAVNLFSRHQLQPAERRDGRAAASDSANIASPGPIASGARSAPIRICCSGSPPSRPIARRSTSSGRR